MSRSQAAAELVHLITLTNKQVEEILALPGVTMNTVQACKTHMYHVYTCGECNAWHGQESRKFLEKASLFNGKYWTLTPGKIYGLKGLRDSGEFKYLGVARADYYAFQHVTTGRLIEAHTKAMQVQLSDGSWYYPWGEPTEKHEGDARREPACVHEYVDVGFMHPKIVCKFCDKEKEL